MGIMKQLLQVVGIFLSRTKTFLDFTQMTPPTHPLVPLDSQNSLAIRWVHGLALIQLWLGTETFCGTVLMVLTAVVCYSIFVNNLDLFDQFRSINATEYRKLRVGMSMLTFP